jgi:hypothetical protein
MTAKIFEFKPKLAMPTHRLYGVILEAFNQAHVLKVTAQALSAPSGDSASASCPRAGAALLAVALPTS